MEDEIRTLKNRTTKVTNENKTYDLRIKENQDKIKMNTRLPHLVATVGEIIDWVEDEEDGNGSGLGQKNIKKGQQPKTKEITKAIVIKTSTRSTYFLPSAGLCLASELRPGELLGVNKDSYNIYEKLPPEYDSRVKAMEIDEKPKEEYTDIGGLDKQIEELVEAIVLPMTQKDKFKKLGIRPPKGLLLHGPPGTGKTLMARACAA